VKPFIKAALRGLRTAWLIVGLTLVLVVLIDRALKALLPAPDAWPLIQNGARDLPSAQTDALRGLAWVDDYEREREAAKALRWTPYRYWQRAPFTGTHLNLDENGERRTVQPPTAADAREIWLFGGSTVWGTGAPDADTIPSLLAARLNDPSVRVRNFGETGYVAMQAQLKLIERLRSGERPQLVVLYFGANEVFSALQNNRVGWPQNEHHRALEFNAGRDPVVLLKLLGSRLSGLERLLATPARVPAIAPLADALSADVGDTLRELRALAALYGFALRVVWQPQLFTKRTLSPSEVEALGARALVHRELALATTARVRQGFSAAPEWLDLSATLDAVDAPVYLDFCHLSPAGNALVVDALIEPLRAAL
jgi:lysophospholipase L1-like esterase